MTAAGEQTSSCLFVGGSLDGEVRALRGRPETYNHMLPRADHHIVEDYARESIHVGSAVFNLYRHTAISMAEVVMRLISSYAEVRR